MKIVVKSLLLANFLFFFALTELFAQSSTVTFNVNLEPQLKDSIFIPGRDWIVITGNQYPFNKPENRLSDTSTPKDSVYSVTLRFSEGDLNNKFDYSFVMYLDGKPQRESMIRQIIIRPGEEELDPLYFDAFAW